MRKVNQTNSFKRDFRRESRGKYRDTLKLNGELREVVYYLENDIPLPLKYRDHMLRNNWEGTRECHIKPDFLLLYRLEGEDLLILERLGTHSEIFGL